MALYMICYDLNKQKNYPALYEAIKNVGTDWCRVVDSTWFVITHHGSVAIRDHLRRAADSDDSLFVVQVTTPAPAAWIGLSDEVNTWLKSRLERINY
jgi:hypothetical protein